MPDFKRVTAIPGRTLIVHLLLMQSPEVAEAMHLPTVHIHANNSLLASSGTLPTTNSLLALSKTFGIDDKATWSWGTQDTLLGQLRFSNDNTTSNVNMVPLTKQSGFGLQLLLVLGVLVLFMLIIAWSVQRKTTGLPDELQPSLWSIPSIAHVILLVVLGVLSAWMVHPGTWKRFWWLPSVGFVGCVLPSAGVPMAGQLIYFPMLSFAGFNPQECVAFGVAVQAVSVGIFVPMSWLVRDRSVFILTVFLYALPSGIVGLFIGLYVFKLPDMGILMLFLVFLFACRRPHPYGVEARHGFAGRSFSSRQARRKVGAGACWPCRGFPGSMARCWC